MRRIRFSLRALLIVATALILFLGYSQIRRRDILRQVDEIRRLGSIVELPQGPIDYLWQRRPTRGTAIIPVTMTSASKAEHDGELQYDLINRMQAVGVQEISVLGKLDEE